MNAPESEFDPLRFARLGGLVVGVSLFAATLLLPGPADLPESAQRVLAIALLMGGLWVGESLPLAVTALLPLVLFPALGVMSTKNVAPYYANRWVFLLMGGFFIAMSMQKWNLHRRIALRVIRVVGMGARRLVLGFMLASAFISMWISNSATAMMMMPIALAIMIEIEKACRAAEGRITRNVANFGAALALGIAYAANVGGVGTLVGTFPNLVFSGQVGTLFPDAPPVTFTSWFAFATPFVVVFVPIIWALLVFVLLPVRGELVESASEIVDREIAALGPMRRGEIDTLIVFIATALLWVTRGDVEIGDLALRGWGSRLGLDGLVGDATVAIAMGGLLFAIPIDWRRGEYVMDWERAAKLPWGLLLLFSSGFAIAAGFVESGLSEWIGSRLEVLEGVPVPLMVFAIAMVVTFLTEFTSNTATTTMLLPIMASLAAAMHTHPFVLMLPVVVSASCAFMLPFATPPNAIVFSTGRVTIRQMMRTGFAINLVGAVLVTLLVISLGRDVLQATPGEPPPWALPAPSSDR